MFHLEHLTWGLLCTCAVPVRCVRISVCVCVLVCVDVRVCRGAGGPGYRVYWGAMLKYLCCHVAVFGTSKQPDYKLSLAQHEQHLVC